MVSLLGLFEDNEILVEKGLLGECDSIDTGQLLTLFIASPVSSGDRGKLYCLDYLCIAKMGALAKVSERPVGIICNGAVLELGDKLLLVLVAFFRKICHCIGLGDILAYKILLFSRKLEHLLLYLRKVGVGKCHTAEVDIIVEAVLNSRSDTEFNARVESLESLCHKM